MPPGYGVSPGAPTGLSTIHRPYDDYDSLYLFLPKDVESLVKALNGLAPSGR